MTLEEFEKLRKQMEHDSNKAKERQEQARRDFENGIFFIEEKKQENTEV